MVRSELSSGLGSGIIARIERGLRYLHPKKPFEIALVSGERRAKLPRASHHGAEAIHAPLS